MTQLFLNNIFGIRASILSLILNKDLDKCLFII